jgi:hypothetical protein
MQPKILLRKNAGGPYYAGPGEWTDERLAAIHFKSAHDAVRVTQERRVHATHLVFVYEVPECLVTVPIVPDLSAISHGSVALCR